MRRLSRLRISRFLVSCVLMLLGFLALSPAGPAQEETPEFDDAALEFFERQVRPLLARRCLECHGRGNEIQGGLRLDSRQSLIVGGDTGPAIMPGNPETSLLIDAVNYGELYEMPPKSKLPEADIAVLTRWVALGAPWPRENAAAATATSDFDLPKRRDSHWAWQPIAAPSVPAVHDGRWPRQELDNFILARLEQAGLKPAPRADRRTLIRRLFFDLIGLPPTPEEVDLFIGDTSDDAYGELVNRLLESPHFGERWARHWLDLVRYAETCGHEFDYPIRHAWKYRDYVIRALNDDVRYDQFVMEHIAGDLLSEPRQNAQAGFNESIIGTGFWFLHEATHAPVDVRGDEALRIDNQIDVMTKTFLGMTVACVAATITSLTRLAPATTTR